MTERLALTSVAAHRGFSRKYTRIASKTPTTGKGGNLTVSILEYLPEVVC